MPNTKGNWSDFECLLQDRWLRNTAIIPRIYEQKGRWHVVMLYVAVEQPLRFLCRWINDYDSFRKAGIHANLFRRNIQKDARGVLKINEHAFTYCLN